MIVSKHRHPPALVLGTLLLAGSMTRLSKSDKTDLFSTHLLPLPSCTAASHSLQLLQAHQKHCLIQTEIFKWLYILQICHPVGFSHQNKSKNVNLLLKKCQYFMPKISETAILSSSPPLSDLCIYFFSTGHVLKPVVVLRHISILKIQSLPGLGAEY